MKYCTAGARHWFTYYGYPGSSAPTCRRCGADNPAYRPRDDIFREVRDASGDR